MKVGGSVKDTRLRGRNMKKINEIDEAINEADKVLEGTVVETEKNEINQKVDLRGLKCEGIDDLKQFKDLTESIERYSEDCKRTEPKMHAGKSIEWKKILYTLLYNLLSQCSYTRNYELQVEHLKRVHEWYYKKVGQTVQNYEEVGKKWVKVDENQDSNQKSPGLAVINSRNMPFVSENYEVARSKTPGGTFNYDTQARLDSVFKEYRLRDLSEKQKMDSMHFKVKTWLKTRPKRQEELLRTQESAKYGFNHIKHEAISVQPPLKHSKILDLTTSPSKTEKEQSNYLNLPKSQIKVSNKAQTRITKIALIREKYKKIINDDSYNDQPYSALDHNSESFTIGTYSKSVKNHRKYFPRMRTAALQARRTERTTGLTEISRPLSSEKCRKIEEIEIIKEKLAKRNVLCGIETLKYGLVLNDDLPDEILTYKSLPNPGSGLLSGKSVEFKTPRAIIKKKMI